MRKPIQYFALLVTGLFVFVSQAVAAENVIPEPPAGNLKYSITVSKFKNEAGWRGQWEIGDGMETVMTNILQQSGWFIVLGDSDMRKEAMKEQDLADSGRTAGGKKAPKIGRMTPAQLLVRGSITHVQNTTQGSGGGLNFKGFSIGGSKGQAEMNVTIYLVDSETGQVKASTDIVGQSGRKAFSLGYHGGLLGGLGGNFGGQKQDNVGKALEDAVGQATVFLIEQLESIPWEGSIVLAKGDKIVINRGSREGVELGREFKVGGVEELVDPDTGEVLDSEMTQVATIKVNKVKEKIAYCSLVDGGGIEKGMTVFPMN